MVDCAGHVALAAATALAWIGAGSLLLAPLPKSGDRALDALNRLGAGAVAFALLTFAAGWLGLLSAPAYAALLALAALGGAAALVRAIRGGDRIGLRAWPAWQIALAALIASYVVAALLVTCAPISSADALFYHATVPELFEREGRIVELPWMWQSYQPFTVELLVLDGFLLWDSVQGAFAPLLLGLGGAATVFVVAHRLRGRGAALLATAIFLCQPFALWLLTSTFVEPAAAFTVALAAANLVRFVRGAGTEALVLAGLFSGATAGMKYIAGAAAAVLALATLALLRRRLTTRSVAAFAVPAALVALPWFVKNTILVGDPAYPLLGGWENEETREANWETFRQFGHGRSPTDLLLLPFRLLADAGEFNRAEYITPLLLLFAPVALLDPRARRFGGLALACVAAYVFMWFLSVQDARYLLPAMPVLAVLAALGALALARNGRAGRVVATASCVVAFTLGAGISLVYAARFAPFVVGSQDETEFLRDAVSYHDSVVWLNARVGPKSRLVVDHSFLLHHRAQALPWTSDALTVTAGPTETRRFFRRYGITHALVFAANSPRKRQLAYVGARLIGDVSARAVISRTRRTVGPPERMELYEVPARA